MITCWSSKKICSKENLLKEFQSELQLRSGYPKYIGNAIIKCVLLRETLINDVIIHEEKDQISTVFINKNCLGEKGEYLLKKCFKKFGRSTNQKVNFLCRYFVTKVSFFTNVKNDLNKVSKSNVAYHYLCPGCESSYITKAEQTIFQRTKEHVTREDSWLKGTLIIAQTWYIYFLLIIWQWVMPTRMSFRLNLVRQNVRRIDHSNNWNASFFKEAHHITEKFRIIVSKCLGKCNSFECLLIIMYIKIMF